MVEVLQAIREANADAETIVVIWDNYSAHLTQSVQAKAVELEIVLVNLPVYSPDLNPIERIWKEVKKAISQQAFIKTVQELEQIIKCTFEECCQRLSFAKSWIENIYIKVFVNSPIAFSEKL